MMFIDKDKGPEIQSVFGNFADRFEIKVYTFSSPCMKSIWAVEFATTYAISAYHHWHCEFKSCSGEVYSKQHCDKVCQWLATGQWFSPGSPVSSNNKTDRHDITEIVLKVALNAIKPTNQYSKCYTRTYEYTLAEWTHWCV
jgi:hypothetical protein